MEYHENMKVMLLLYANTVHSVTLILAFILHCFKYDNVRKHNKQSATQSISIISGVGSMMDRTSFGMPKGSQPVPAITSTSQSETKPVLPKRSPAPKQDTHVSTSVMETMITKSPAEERSGYSMTTGLMANQTEMKPITGRICKHT